MTMEPSDTPMPSTGAIGQSPVSQPPGTGARLGKPVAAKVATNYGDEIVGAGSGAASQSAHGGGATTDAQHPLDRHMLGALMGEPTQFDIDRTMSKLNQTGGPVLIYRYEGKVLHHWREYLAARKLGLPVVFNDVETDDPQGFLIGVLCDGRGWAGYQRAAMVVLIRLWQGPGRPNKAANVAGFSEATDKPMTVAEMATEAKVCDRYIYMAKRVHRQVGEETLRRVIHGEISLDSVDKRYRAGRKDGDDGDPGQTTADDALEERQSDCNDVGPANMTDQNRVATIERDPNPTALVLELTLKINRLRRENRRLKTNNRLLTATVERLRGYRRSPVAVAARKSEQHASFAAEHRSGGADHERGARSDARAANGQLRLIE